MGTFRLATLKDADELLEIYTPYVLKTSFSMELSPPTLDEFRGRISTFCEKYPYIVYEENGEIIGYAYAHDFHERRGFRFNAESTIYIKENFSHHGIGGKLYDKLFEILKEQNILKVWAIIGMPNDNSVRFHEKYGFRKVATFEKTGYKFSEWHDIVYMEYILGHDFKNPPPVKKITELDPKIIKTILDK